MLKGRSSGNSQLMLSKNKGAGGKHKRACLGMKQAGCAKPQLLESHGLVPGLIAQGRSHCFTVCPDTDQIPARALLKAISCELMQSVD